MKTVMIFVLFGGLLGAIAASLIVPPTLSWYNESGFLSQGQNGQVQALVNIPQVIHYTTTRLIKGQLIGTIAGAVLGLVVGILAARGGSRRAVPAASPSVPRPPA
ncbi:MAG: hypothetical protein M3S32_02805 [Acidobacteriota bacterium]|nr:hypothetical protein [Acidobacteriota bacterium]